MFNIISLFKKAGTVHPGLNSKSIAIFYNAKMTFYSFHAGNGNDAVLYNTAWFDSPFFEKDNAVRFTAPGDK